MKADRNFLPENAHPFNQFESIDEMTPPWNQNDLIQTHLIKQDLAKTLKDWNILLLLTNLLSEIVAKKTNLRHSDLMPSSIQREKLSTLVDRKNLDLLVRSLVSPGQELTETEINDCKGLAKQLIHLSQNCWNLKDTITHILETNFKLQRQFFTLQQQLLALQQSHPFDDKELQELIVPGKYLQNDIRVNWSYLREKHGIILDQPIGHYHFGIYQLLEKTIVVPGNEAYLIKDLLATTREAFKTTASLQETDMMGIEKQLHRYGLCFNLPFNRLLTRFYFSYFACTPLIWLPASTRISNALRSKKIETIGDLLNQTEAYCSHIPHMGETSMIELRALLEAMDLQFNMQEADFKKLYLL